MLKNANQHVDFVCSLSGMADRNANSSKRISIISIEVSTELREKRMRRLSRRFSSRANYSLMNITWIRSINATRLVESAWRLFSRSWTLVERRRILSNPKSRGNGFPYLSFAQSLYLPMLCRIVSLIFSSNRGIPNLRKGDRCEIVVPSRLAYLISSKTSSGWLDDKVNMET